VTREREIARELLLTPVSSPRDGPDRNAATHVTSIGRVRRSRRGDRPDVYEVVTMGAAAQDILARARGCLLGQVAGDSLGGLVEFRAAPVIRAQYPNDVRELADGGHWRTIAGQPTDDSELALALARSLVEHGRFDDDAVAAAYGRWYASEPFDCGNTVARALSVAAGVGDNHARHARAVASETSQANGALMRVSPLGMFGHAVEPDVLAEWARRDASLTHPHPFCQDASALFAVAVAYTVRTGDTPRGVFDFASAYAADAELDPNVGACLRDAGRGENVRDFSSQMGWVKIALTNAFFQLVHATSLEEGVVDTVMRGGDTDTNAAVAGVLLGAAYGEAAVPEQWRSAVMNCRPEAGRPNVRRPRPREYWPCDVIELADRLVAVGAEQQQ
jgi:ADP-ribosyl-[dinitrogen reductase] hydrolase